MKHYFNEGKEIMNQGKSKKQLESSNIGCFFSGIGLLIMIVYLIIGGIL